MRRKIFIASISILVFLIIFFGVNFAIWIINSHKIRKDTLSFLKENLEFCQIVKDKIFFSKGEFWLICNKRPFYAVYENGKINYELNGWGFLKQQPEILAELQKNKCNFYYSEDNKLIFVCKDRKIRTYNFSLSDFRLQKDKEDLFVNYFLKNDQYGCTVLDDFGFELNGEEFLGIKGSCQGQEIEVAFNLDKLYFTLPIITEKGLTGKERAEKSFELIFSLRNICKLEFLQEVPLFGILLGLDCNLGRPKLVYEFKSKFPNFLIPESEFETLFLYLRDFSFPSLEGKCEFIRSQENDKNILKYYSCNERIIVAKILKGSGMISEIYLKSESL